MKRLLFGLLMLLPFIGFGQSCSDEDTVRSITSSLVTATSARVNGSVSHFSGAVTGLQLRYVRQGQTDTATASGSFSSALRNLNGLQASTVYIYYYKTICGSGTARNSIGPFTFTTLSNNVLYAPERPTVFNYVKADSGLRIPSVDTSLYRAAAGASIVYKTSDDTYYAYYVDCSCWRSLATDSAGVIAALDLKVDSVTISGDSLFWWNDHGVSHGYILPVMNTVWKLAGNASTTPGTDYLGTSDAQSFVIKTNAIERMRFNTSGAIAVGSGTDYGTSGYVLKSNGNAAAPTWVTPASISPTWQEVLDAGSVLTTPHTVTGTEPLTFLMSSSGLDGELSVDAGSVVWVSRNQVTDRSSSVDIMPDSIVLRPSVGILKIDTLTNAVGTKAIRYNPTTGLITYADTTVASSGTYLPLAGAAYTTTTGDGLALTTSTLTTGNLMKLTNTSTVNNGAGLLSIVSSGANSTASKTTYGQQISVTNTGTTSTNVGLNVTASGATNNYAALFTGNVGIGTSSPTAAKLQVTGNGAASVSGGLWDGTWFTGGSATTTKPQLLIEPTGTTSTAWSTSGTGLGINAASGFTGNLIDAQLNGVSKFSISSAGVITLNNSTNKIVGTSDRTSLYGTTYLEFLSNGTQSGYTNGTAWQLNGNTGISGSLTITGSTVLNGAIAAADGANKSVGVSAAMTAGTITISNTRVTANSRIFLTHATVGGTQGILSVGTIVAGTSFVINSSSATDTGTVNWLIIN